MIWNLPNTLTWLRIFAIPLVVVLYSLPYHWSDPAAGLLFAAAGITDSLDGYFARKYGQTSKLGAFLDPVADKLIVAVALVLIVSKDPQLVVVLTAIVIIGREIAISALREWMAEIGQRKKVAVSRIGKHKTILQLFSIVAILFLLIAREIPAWNSLVAPGLWAVHILLYVVLAWTLYSGYRFVAANRRILL